MTTDSSAWKPWMDRMKRNALIVGDDPSLQHRMGAQLRRMNFNVESAGNYVAATERLASREFHVVCVSVQLPCRSGYDLCDHIRGSPKLSALPILMMSAYGSPLERTHAEDAGASAFLKKPFSIGRFTQCMESLIGQRRSSVLPTRDVRPLAWMSIFDRSQPLPA
ncbi:MAG: response regulator [Polyangiaceae bacterium]|jgi:DNA-binding response OmpR family regulator